MSAPAIATLNEVINFQEADLALERAEIVAHYVKSAEELGKIGARLIALKKRLKRGEYTDFLSTLPFSERTAYNFIHLARAIEDYGIVAIVAENRITLAAWYAAPLDKSEVVTEMFNRARAGEMVTAKEVQGLIQATKIEDDRLRHALHNAAQDSPNMVVEMLNNGVINTVDGIAVGLGDATAQDIALAASQDRYERQQRHITENSAAQAKLTIDMNFEIREALKARLPKGAVLPECGTQVTLLWRKDES